MSWRSLDYCVPNDFERLGVLNVDMVNFLLLLLEEALWGVRVLLFNTEQVFEILRSLSKDFIICLFSLQIEGARSCSLRILCVCKFFHFRCFWNNTDLFWFFNTSKRAIHILMLARRQLKVLLPSHSVRRMSLGGFKNTILEYTHTSRWLDRLSFVLMSLLINHVKVKDRLFMN